MKTNVSKHMYMHINTRIHTRIYTHTQHSTFIFYYRIIIFFFCINAMNYLFKI